MGERLNIEVVKGNKLLANSYYHWSGYSNCAVNLTIEIVKSFEYIKKYKVDNVKNKDILLAIRLLEATGAGTNESQISNTIKTIGLIDTNVEIKKCKGRNEGIIEISEEGMNENRSWEESRVTIDIETQKINFEAYNEIDEEDKKYYEEEAAVEFKNINVDFNNIKFEDIFDLKAFIDKNNYNSQYFFKNEFDNKYISLIL